jgi:hypothetical protein
MAKQKTVNSPKKASPKKASPKKASPKKASPKQDKPIRQSNDPIYKELISTFLDQFIQTVFPDLAEVLDLEKAVERQQELYVYDKDALHGHKKFADLLYEVPRKDQGPSKQIFIHIELENNDGIEEMKRRMRHYFYLIDLKYDISNLIPIVLFFNNKGKPGITRETVSSGDELFEVSKFNFIQWGLGNDQVENWLLNQPKSLYAALAMHMQHPKMTDAEVLLKALEVVNKSVLTSSQEQLLIDYIYSFSKLGEQAKTQVYQQINQQEHSTQGVKQMIKRWSQHIAEQSILEGEINALVIVAQAKGITLETNELEILKEKGLDQIKKALVMLVNAQSKNDLKPLFQS